MNKIETISRMRVLNETSRPSQTSILISTVESSPNPCSPPSSQPSLAIPVSNEYSNNKLLITLLSSASSSTASTSSSSNSSSLSSASSTTASLTVSGSANPNTSKSEETKNVTHIASVAKQDESLLRNKSPSVSRSSSASSSSVIAALSILSFSTTSSAASSSPSTSTTCSSSSSNTSLSSSNSFQVEEVDSSNDTSIKLNKNLELTTSADLKKESRSFSSAYHSQQNSFSDSSSKMTSLNYSTSNRRNSIKENLSANDVSELLAPYLHKPFYGKDWLFRKLSHYVTTKKLLNEKFDPSSNLLQQNANNPLRTSDSNLNQNAPTKNHSTCLVLLGDSGTGKTHLCCELKHPKPYTYSSNQLSGESIKPYLACVHFCNLFNKRQNSLKCLYIHLTRSLQELHASLAEKQQQKMLFARKRLIKMKYDDFLAPIRTKTDETFDQDHDLHETLFSFSKEADCSRESSLECIDSLASKFIGQILKPLNNIENSKNYFIIIDGLEDTILQHERLLLPQMPNDNTDNCDGETILKFLNKTFLYYPPWLNLVITSKRCTEKSHLRTHLTNIKYDKMSIDRCYNISAVLGEINVFSGSSNDSSKNASSCSINTSNSINDNLTHLQSTIHSLVQQHHQSNRASLNLSYCNHMSSPMELCNAAHFANLKDIQTYILKRLDQNHSLKLKFNSASASKTSSIELINLMLIKSNYSVLYVEKIFDLILIDFMHVSEISLIPVTLNGLYLYIIEKVLRNLQFSDNLAENDNFILKEIKKQKIENIDVKDLLYALFGIILIESKPFTKQEIFTKLSCRFFNLSFELYQLIFDYLTPVFFTKWTKNAIDSNIDNRFILFHTSLVDWFTDVKFSTQKYFNNLGESHFVLAYYYFNKLTAAHTEMQSNRKVALWEEFKFHLAHSKNLTKNSATSNDCLLAYIYKLCEYDYEYKVVLDTLDRKLLQCKRLLSIDNQPKTYAFGLEGVGANKPLVTAAVIEGALLDLVTRGDLPGLKKYLKGDFYRLVNILCKFVDKFNQTALLIAVKLNNFEFVEYLTSFRLIDLDHCDNNGWTALRYSAWSGNQSIVRNLLEYGASVDLSDNEGRTALRAAVFSGHDQISKLLIKYHANVNKCDKENRSMLHVAVYMGHLNLVNMLLLNGALINYQDSLGRSCLSTALFTSSTKSQYDLMKFLIKCGASLDLPDSGHKTCLILATEANLKHIVELLLNNGADIDFIDADGFTALTHAVCHKHDELVELLLKRNAATHILDKDGRSILSMASRIDARKILRMLMERGLDEMHRDNAGWTPLHEAAQHGHVDIAEMLLNYGSEIDAADNEGKTSLFYACREGHLDVIRLLVQRNANVNLRAHDGTSAFRVSCAHMRYAICKYLLERGAEVNGKDLDGRTTLYCLMWSNQSIDMIKFLLDNGASPNERDNEGRTCLHVIATMGHVDHLNLLLNENYSRSLNINQSDNNGSTPLLAACWHDKLAIVQLMLQNSVRLNLNINQRDKQGATALSVACQRGNYLIVHELLSHNAHFYASSRNPIKLAMQGGHNDVVKLLQLFAAKNYQPKPPSTATTETSMSSTSSGMPRNSKSLDSIKAFNSSRYSFDRAGVSILNQRFAITPNTYSIQQQQQSQMSHSSSCYPVSNSSTPSGYTGPNNAYIKTFDLMVSGAEQKRQFKNNSLMINLNEPTSDTAATELEEDFFDTSFSYSNSSSQVNKSSPTAKSSSSRLKLVCDKLLSFKKSETSLILNLAAAAAQTKRSNSINLASRDKFNEQQKKQASSPSTPKSISPSRMYMPVSLSTASSSLAAASSHGASCLNNNSCLVMNKKLTDMSPRQRIASEYSRDTIATNSTSSTITSRDTKHAELENLRAGHQKSIKSKISNSKFFQAIGKKFKIFNKNSAVYGNSSSSSGVSSKVATSYFELSSASKSNYDIHSHHHSDSPGKSLSGSVRQMQRSVTDTIGSSGFYVALEASAKPVRQSSVRSSMNTLNEEDDSAHIFKRNSLHDCLNPRRSFREHHATPSSPPPLLSDRVISTIEENNGGSENNNLSILIGSNSVKKSANDGSPPNQSSQQITQPKRPTCLALNYTKKETCI